MCIIHWKIAQFFKKDKQRLGFSSIQPIRNNWNPKKSRGLARVRKNPSATIILKLKEVYLAARMLA
jgi:hypothetical protein